MQIKMIKRIANLVSNILNPFLVSPAVILLLSFEATSSIFDALKWSLILIVLSLLPVYSVIIYLVRNRRVEGFSINVRKQRTKVYLLAGVCAGISCVILRYFGAPPLLIATAVAGFSAVVVFLFFNLWWKISVHTAFVAVSVAILIILYGWIAVVAVLLVPLTAWARIELEHHSLTQVITGTLLGASIVVAVFYLFGLVQLV